MCWFGGIEKETTAVLRAPVSWAMWICVVFGGNIHLSIARAIRDRTIRDRTEPDHPPTNQLITGSRHLPSYSRVLRPKLPPLLLASIRRWSSTIVIAATWWIERNEGENDSRAKNSCLRLVHRKLQKTRDRVTALRRTVTPQTLSVFVYDSRGGGCRAIGLQ